MKQVQQCATDRCIEILVHLRKSFVDNRIWNSAIPIIDRMLRAPEVLANFYSEIAQLDLDKYAAELLSTLITGVCVYSPAKLSDLRVARTRLVAVNNEIATLAGRLSDLLEERDAIQNQTSMTSSTHSSIIDVIEQASSTNYSFRFHVKEPFEEICSKYDSKYWPDLADVIKEIGENASKHQLQYVDGCTEVAIGGKRGSRTDTVRAIFSAIDELMECQSFGFPNTFRLSNESAADFLNCALGLEVHELMDGPYIKTIRSRDKAKIKKAALLNKQRQQS